MQAGTSRAPSVFSQSTARDILKRRDKPFKTEQKKVLAKKRKLDLHTSYAYGDAPPGYAFVPVGTPDLSDLCKELSRQRGFAVNVVNAKPSSKYAQDPEKISHHIHRVGYHFRSEVIEEACSKLGYIVYQNHFIKEADLLQQQRESFIAKVMMKHGLQVQASNKRETPEQVRAAIKELFPKIPQNDLDEIVEHAWAEGTKRVGNNQELDLPRRVQLAVIARIRHMYTDYDRLLRAFDWADARKEVEPDCLKVLIAWRGENDNEDDNELEEIVRETIVIDDADADVDHARPEEDSGDVTDTSVEISHRPAAPEDLRAEDPQDRDNIYLQRYQPYRRTIAERNNIARAKIDAIRGQMREKPAQPAYGYRILPPHPQPTDRPETVRTHVQTDRSGHLPKQIVVDGVVMRRASPDRSSLSSVTLQYPRAGPGSLYQMHSAQSTPAIMPQYLARSHATARSHDSYHPVPSIEGGNAQSVAGRSDHAPNSAPKVYHLQPSTPVSVRTTDYAQPASQYATFQSHPNRQEHHGAIGANPHQQGESMDLSSPRYSKGERYDAQPGIFRVVPANTDNGHGQYQSRPQSLGLPTYAEPSNPNQRIVYVREANPAYRPSSDNHPHQGGYRPVYERPSRPYELPSSAPIHGAPAPLRIMPHPQVRVEPSHSVRYVEPISSTTEQPNAFMREADHQQRYNTVYLQPQPQRRSQISPTPRPIHGAPAPVQQASTDMRQSLSQQRPISRPAPQPPYTESVHPDTSQVGATSGLQYNQYYYPR